jgi:hypothetical protein
VHLKQFFVPAAVTLALGTLAPAAWATTSIDGCQKLTQSGYYKLTRNVNVTSGICFTIASDNVTLDLGGYSVRSTGTGYGVYADPAGGAPRTGIVVRNGTVGSFDTGIDLTWAFGAVIENINSSVNSGAGIRASNGALVRHVQARSNGGTGVDVGGGSFVTDLLLDGNRFDGVRAGPASRITNTSATFNGGEGIYVSTFHYDSVISGNSAEGNKKAGILADCGAIITGNTLPQFFPNGGRAILARETNVLYPGPTYRTNNSCDKPQSGTVVTQSRIDQFPDQ